MAPILIRRHFHPPFRALLFLGIFSLSAFLLLCLFHDPLSAPSSALCPSPKCEFRQIFCLIDGKRRIPCIRHKEDVFLPFNGFLRNRFDLSGQFGNKTGIFEYFTSDVKSTKSKGRMVDPLEAFNGVAMRQRVKCLHPQNGLPMTIQWEPLRTFPYFYPVQILQFGFEHFTRNRSLAPTKILRRKLGRGKRTKLEGGNLLEGQSEEFGLFPNLDILFFKWRPRGGEARFELIFLGENGRKIKLEFRQSERRECLWRGEKGEELHFVYGLSPANSPVEFLLDLPIFLEKALSISSNSSQSIGRIHQRPFQGKFRPKLLRIFGPSFLEFDSIRQQNAAHQEIFWRVADWLLANQDQKGGWPVPIQRAFDIDQGRHKLSLDPGWHNAMAQGHALSFLSRAFEASGEKRFLEAGHRALDLFEIPAEQGGVLNRLFGLEWFEEYPTWPNGTFVLNGFLYALIGLWDFSAHSNHSLQLFQRGVHSLGQLLPLYDLGQRSAYDLRHIRLGNRPNIARWDYHALHISLLDSIHSITGESLFGQIAQRWGEYARGTELKHN